MHFRKAIVLSVSALSLLSAICPDSAESRPVKSKTSARNSSSASAQSEEAAVRGRLTALRTAVTSGDAKGITALWTEDGHYIDDTGAESVGRDALLKTFTAAVQENGKPQVNLSAESIRFPASNIALVEGTVKRVLPGAPEEVPVGRYTLTFVKKGGEWLISQGTETPFVAQAPTQGNPLNQMEWLVGDWQAEREGLSAHIKAEWVPSKNFIFCRYEIDRPNTPKQLETQVIGWDPRADQPVSWTFDSRGGYGNGSWRRENNKWIVDATGVQRSGAVTTATNVLTPDGPNSFFWQSINRQTGGVLMPDTNQLKITRVSK